MDMKDSVLVKMNESFALGGDSLLWYKQRLCIPDVDDLQTGIIVEAHGYKYSIHPGSTKMYHDLKEIYWWDGLKRDNAEFVAKCLNCKKFKAKHLNPGGLTQIMDVSTQKWEAINIDFVVGLPRDLKQNDSIWASVHRLTKSAHFIPVKFIYTAEDYARIQFLEGFSKRFRYSS